MRTTNCLSVGIFLWLLFSAVGTARPVQCWFPEQLEPKATLICNGTVISVEDTGIKKNFSYPYISPSENEEMVMLAKIKVLHIFKGQAPAVIEFRYRVSTQMVADGAEHIQLEKGKRYRFFLKPGDKPGQYISVLEGNFDDSSAVEGLSSGEQDDGPYLHKEEVIKVAHDFLKSMKLESTVDWVHPAVYCFCDNEKGFTWNVLLFHPHPGAPSKGSVLVAVRGDCTANLEQTIE